MYQLETIADIIEGATLATLGEDMFIYHSPAEVENCLILYPSNDPPIIDPDTPNYYHGKFQTIVRNATHDAGIALCKQLETTLTKYNYDTPEIFIKYVRPLYQARVYRRSDSGALEFSITYEIRFIVK